MPEEGRTSTERTGKPDDKDGAWAGRRDAIEPEEQTGPPESPRKQQGDRTGAYGGDDGALEHERADIAPGEDPGITGSPTGRAATTGQGQGQRKQDEDLASGEENPG